VLVSSKSRAALVAAAALLSLCACGRRGDLEPPSANAVQKPQDKHDLQIRRPNQKIAPPDRDFVLDPLLK
jgi:predicted small lipoprotein YifL